MSEDFRPWLERYLHEKPVESTELPDYSDCPMTEEEQERMQEIATQEAEVAVSLIQTWQRQWNEGVAEAEADMALNGPPF